MDKPSAHGMLVVGTDVIYLSHLPMFHSPHNYQLIFEATLSEEELAVYRADVAAHPEALYTLAPTVRWVLPDTIREEANFTGDLYRGHFERGGAPIARGMTVKVKHIIHFRRFEANGKGDSTQWLAFGRGREQFLAHRIQAPPDMDQVVQVSAPPAEGQTVLVPQVGELEVDESVLTGKVQRVIYTEYGGLAQ